MPETRREATGLIGFLLVVMTWGALMAGLRAGTAHNTFPTMSGYWIPPGLFDLSPWWINPSRTARPSSSSIAGSPSSWCWACWRWPGARAGRRRWRRGDGALQLGLGIATILSGVDIAVATLHQAGAVLLLTAVIVVRHRATPSPAQPRVGYCWGMSGTRPCRPPP